MSYVTQCLFLTFLIKSLLMMYLDMNHIPLYPFTTVFVLVVTVPPFDLIFVLPDLYFIICTNSLFCHASIIYGLSIRMYLCTYFLVFLVAFDMYTWNIVKSESPSLSLSYCANGTNVIFLDFSDDLYFLYYVLNSWNFHHRHHCLYLFLSIYYMLGTQPDSTLFYPHLKQYIFS